MSHAVGNPAVGNPAVGNPAVGNPAVGNPGPSAMPRRIPFHRPTRPADRRLVETKRERDRFYSSSRWEALRLAYLAEFPLCQRCEALGLLVEARIVHHKRERLDAPDLAFDWDNLEALCSPCHTRHHKGR